MTPRKPVVRWLIAAAAFLLSVAVLSLLNRSVSMDTLSRWLLAMGLLLAGVAAAIAILWYMRPVGNETGAKSDDDVILALRAVRAKLPHGGLAGHPVVLVLGPEGSAKTSLMARSGGDPQLLVGESPAGSTDVPAPTRAANIWILQSTVFAELSSELLGDGKRFQKSLHMLRAPSVMAAIGKSTAEPRAVILCVPCDLFQAENSSSQLQQLAQTMRQRLSDSANIFGLAVPVYVVFTKMDRLPHFEQWISVFTKDELRAPLGASLALDPASNTGNYAERITPRLNAAFDAIVQSLNARRTGLLSRESRYERRYSAFELPRELGKLRTPVVQFLTELCRPSQLGVNPQLRGFYFTGARPVVISQSAAVSNETAASVTAPQGVTSIYRSPTSAAAAAAAPQTHRVPEWVFLDRFLRDVIKDDRSAAMIASGGTSVQRTRRVLLGSAIAALWLLIIGVTSSWFGNRALQNRVTDAGRAVAALPVVQAQPGVIAFPSGEALGRLDALRAQLDTLRAYEKNGPPLRLRFGLWRGAALRHAAEPLWFEGFRKQLFADAWKALNDSLSMLPDVPGASNDYGITYGWLKAYLITTTAPDSATVEFPSSVLLVSWQRGMDTDADITALARRQFEYYSSVLPERNPFPRAADASVVTHARNFLSRYTGAEQIYMNMVTAANKQTSPVRVPQAPGILTSVPEVPGAFTSEGATFMQAALRNADNYFQGETWVVGDATAMKAQDRDSVVSLLRERYHDDYSKTWSQVVQSIAAARPSTIKDAASKLESLAGNQSPLLQVLRTVAVNTTVDSAMIKDFQPVHVVTPPEITDKFISEKNQPYMNGLLGLQGELQQVANLPPAVDTASTQELVRAAQQASSEASRARVSARQVSQEFDLGAGGGAMAGYVEKALLSPIDAVTAVLNATISRRPPAARVAAAPAPRATSAAAAAEAAELNKRGAAICTRIDKLTASFPFNPESTRDASIADVKSILAPSTGELWVFQKERLTPYLTKSGNTWVAKGGGEVELSEAFVTFFNAAAEVSAALFSEDPATPMVRWLASGVLTDKTQLLILKNNGREARFDKKSFKNEVVWPATNGRDAELQAQFKKNKPVTVRKAGGDWAIFRLVATAESSDGQSATWNATGKDSEPVTVKFEALRREASSILTRGWLGRMSCVAQVTR